MAPARVGHRCVSRAGAQTTPGGAPGGSASFFHRPCQRSPSWMRRRGRAECHRSQQQWRAWLGRARKAMQVGNARLMLCNIPRRQRQHQYLLMILLEAQGTWFSRKCRRFGNHQRETLSALHKGTPGSVRHHPESVQGWPCCRRQPCQRWPHNEKSNAKRLLAHMPCKSRCHCAQIAWKQAGQGVSMGAGRSWKTLLPATGSSYFLQR